MAAGAGEGPVGLLMRSFKSEGKRGLVCRYIWGRVPGVSVDSWSGWAEWTIWGIGRALQRDLL
jgi:hypothetical protein